MHRCRRRGPAFWCPSRRGLVDPGEAAGGLAIVLTLLAVLSKSAWISPQRGPVAVLDGNRKVTLSVPGIRQRVSRTSGWSGRWSGSPYVTQTRSVLPMAVPAGLKGHLGWRVPLLLSLASTTSVTATKAVVGHGEDSAQRGRRGVPGPPSLVCPAR